MITPERPLHGTHSSRLKEADICLCKKQIYLLPQTKMLATGLKLNQSALVKVGYSMLPFIVLRIRLWPQKR